MKNTNNIKNQQTTNNKNNPILCSTTLLPYCLDI